MDFLIDSGLILMATIIVWQAFSTVPKTLAAARTGNAGYEDALKHGAALFLGLVVAMDFIELLGWAPHPRWMAYLVWAALWAIHSVAVFIGRRQAQAH